MKVGDQIRVWRMRPRVVHRLPGRVRVHVPLVRHLWRTRETSGVSWPGADAVRSIMSLPEGVESADVSFPTGNVVFTFDVERMDEATIFQYVKTLQILFLRDRDRWMDAKASTVPALLYRVRDVLAGAMRQRPLLDEKVKLPDDFWS